MSAPAVAWAGKLIGAAPLSGSIEEVHFSGDEPGGPWTWVRFDEIHGSDHWAGCFQCGDRGFDSVVMPHGSTDALVVSGGEGYWISLPERALRYREDNITGAAQVPGVPMAIVADDQTVSLLSPDGRVWRTKDIAIDGIQFTTITTDLVCGEADVPEGWVPFEIDIASGITRGGLQW